MLHIQRHDGLSVRYGARVYGAREAATMASGGSVGASRVAVITTDVIAIVRGGRGVGKRPLPE
jgi:hypothetical protein